MVDCVGFADCPCRRHRDDRLAAHDAHHAGRDHDVSLCPACKTADRHAHDSRWAVAKWR